MANRHLTILLADDDDSVLAETCQSARFEADLKIVKNLAETSRYLKGEDGYQDRTLYPLPAVLFLHVGNSRVPVLQFLEEHRQLLKKYRVMTYVFGPALTAPQVGEMIDSGAHTYVVLPPTISTIISMICCLSNWLEHVSFPHEQPALEESLN